MWARVVHAQMAETSWVHGKSRIERCSVALEARGRSPAQSSPKNVGACGARPTRRDVMRARKEPHWDVLGGARGSVKEPSAKFKKCWRVWCAPNSLRRRACTERAALECSQGRYGLGEGAQHKVQKVLARVVPVQLAETSCVHGKSRIGMFSVALRAR